MIRTLPARDAASTWASAAGRVLPHVGALVGLLLVLVGWKGGGPVTVTLGALLGGLALALAAAAMARVGDRQALDHASWLVGAHRALLVVGLTAVAATACAFFVTAPLVTLPGPVAIAFGVVLMLVDAAVRTRRGSRPGADLRDTDTRDALAVLDSLGTWNLLLVAPILLTWLALTLL